MFYEYECTECLGEFLIRKPIADSTEKEWCPTCGVDLRRVWSPLGIIMGEYVAAGYKRTTEIPDELKAGIKRIQESKDIISYPGVAARRKKAMQ